jgi:outer membrane immunogenic protein
MKRILIASAVAFAAGGQALAADLPPPMAPPPRAPAAYIPIAPPYNWSGIYIGGNLGAGWNSTGSITDNLTPASTFGTTTNTSFLGGGQIGVNYEFWGGVVVGAEVMFDWLPNTSNTINVSNTNAAGTTNTATATINNRWLTTAIGKLGYAWDRVLLYGKGGGAWVGTNNPSITVGGTSASFATNSSNNFGWTAGLGVEWAFYGNWSARAEWDYVRLQNQSYTVANNAAGGAFANDTINVNNRSINMFTAGVNYKFRRLVVTPRGLLRVTFTST